MHCWRRNANLLTPRGGTGWHRRGAAAAGGALDPRVLRAVSLDPRRRVGRQLPGKLVPVGRHPRCALRHALRVVGRCPREQGGQPAAVRASRRLASQFASHDVPVGRQPRPALGHGSVHGLGCRQGASGPHGSRPAVAGQLARELVPVGGEPGAVLGHARRRLPGGRGKGVGGGRRRERRGPRSGASAARLRLGQHGRLSRAGDPRLPARSGVWPEGGALFVRENVHDSLVDRVEDTLRRAVRVQHPNLSLQRLLIQRLISALRAPEMAEDQSEVLETCHTHGGAAPGAPVVKI
mmetsp:Transcript_5863/g.17343  ORF Transcript_5863/g.17343 Transcript_5863/m.17343 type:complete len:294 (+) Transcript_5863:124-1005(+)